VGPQQNFSRGPTVSSKLRFDPKMRGGGLSRQPRRESAGVRSISFDGSYERRVALVGARAKSVRNRVYLQHGHYAAVLSAENAGGILPPVTLHFAVTP
jgi:hypothetical protein